jgi:hypothetical protein
MVIGAPNSKENGRALEVPVTVVECVRGAGREEVGAPDIETRKAVEYVVEEGDGSLEKKKLKTVDEEDGRRTFAIELGNVTTTSVKRRELRITRRGPAVKQERRNFFRSKKASSIR